MGRPWLIQASFQFARLSGAENLRPAFPKLSQLFSAVVDKHDGNIRLASASL
jgi:hypothetical protein